MTSRLISIRCPCFVCYSVRTNNHSILVIIGFVFTHASIYKRCALHTSGYTMLPLSRPGAHRTPGCGGGGGRGLLYGYICELMIQSRDSCRAAGAGLIHTVAKSRSGFSRHLGIIKLGHWRKKSKQFSMVNFYTVQRHFVGVSVRFNGTSPYFSTPQICVFDDLFRVIFLVFLDSLSFFYFRSTKLLHLLLLRFLYVGIYSEQLKSFLG